MPLLIDGYNLLHTAQETSDSPALSDVSLCLMLCEFLRRCRQHGTIVFDGVGPRDKGPLEALDRLRVVFSGPDCQADDVIERHISQNTAPRSLIVVSTDRRIVDAAKRRKAKSTRSDDFWFQLCAVLEKKPSISEPREKRIGITDGQAEKWLKEFGL